MLAAGRGTRMGSELPKVLHRAGSAPLVVHVLRALDALGLAAPPLVVASPGGRLEEVLAGEGWGGRVEVVIQDPPSGTADALRVAVERVDPGVGELLVTQGATPLVTSATLAALLDTHARRGASATVLTAGRADPFGYGRVLRDSEGMLAAIVEERDATEEQRLVTEVNAGTYVFAAAGLAGVLESIGRDNDQDEYYLPDVVALLRERGRGIATYTARAEEALGVKSRAHLAEVEAVLRRRVCERWMSEGVTIVDPATTYVDPTATLARGAVVRPFTFIEGDSTVAEGADIGPQTRIVDSDVGARASITFSVVVGASIGPGAWVGPFASLRPGTRLERDAKIGTFVETKQSTIGQNSKVPHLAYVGDAEIGSDVNLGAGTITANWDGRAKHPTVIEDDAYIGSNTVVVAPSRIGKRAATGAGAVVRGEVPDDALAVGVPARILPGKGGRKPPRAGRHEQTSEGT